MVEPVLTHSVHRDWFLLATYAKEQEAFQASMNRFALKATSVEALQAEYIRGDIDVDELEAKLESKFENELREET